MALEKATFSVTTDALEFMVLDRAELPEEFHGFQVVREGPLDNATMAEQGFSGNTAERFTAAGRVTGFMRELGETSSAFTHDGFNFAAATVAHLFDNPQSVSDWMADIFLKDFEEHLGENVGGDQQLISAEPLEVNGFFDEAVALKVLQGGVAGLISSTVIDFRVGRILGVAFIGTIGNHERTGLTTELALALERRIVRVVLGGG